MPGMETDGLLASPPAAEAAALRVNEAFLGPFFENANAGLAILDANLRFLAANSTIAELDGAPVEDHIGRSVYEIMPALVPQIEPFLRAVLETWKPLRNQEVTRVGTV